MAEKEKRKNNPTAGCRWSWGWGCVVKMGHQTPAVILTLVWSSNHWDLAWEQCTDGPLQKRERGLFHTFHVKANDKPSSCWHVSSLTDGGRCNLTLWFQLQIAVILFILFLGDGYSSDRACSHPIPTRVSTCSFIIQSASKKHGCCFLECSSQLLKCNHSGHSECALLHITIESHKNN